MVIWDYLTVIRHAHCYLRYGYCYCKGSSLTWEKSILTYVFIQGLYAISFAKDLNVLYYILRILLYEYLWFIMCVYIYIYENRPWLIL